MKLQNIITAFAMLPLMLTACSSDDELSNGKQTLCFTATTAETRTAFTGSGYDFTLNWKANDEIVVILKTSTYPESTEKSFRYKTNANNTPIASFTPSVAGQEFTNSEVEDCFYSFYPSEFYDHAGEAYLMDVFGNKYLYYLPIYTIQPSVQPYANGKIADGYYPMIGETIKNGPNGEYKTPPDMQFWNTNAIVKISLKSTAAQDGTIKIDSLRFDSPTEDMSGKLVAVAYISMYPGFMEKEGWEGTKHLTLDCTGANITLSSTTANDFFFSVPGRNYQPGLQLTVFGKKTTDNSKVTISYTTSQILELYGSKFYSMDFTANPKTFSQN